MRYTIITNRKYECRHWYDLVREWEDDLTDILHANFLYEPAIFKNRYWQFIPMLFTKIVRHEEFPSLYFEMKANVFHFWKGHGKIVPWIIDWYVNPRWMWVYNLMYKKHRVVLISSAEVYHYLKKKGCDLPIAHLALSLSDRYRIDGNSVFCKKYDVVLLGRKNPVLWDFLETYKKTHPALIVYKPRKEEVATREDYINMIRNSRIGFYATPGIDGGEARTKGFSQVTPRFLEFIAGGCHIIARYRKNEDIDYFELDKFCESIESYQQFEAAMDKAMGESVDMVKYANYLEKHYTSTRAIQLKQIIDNV